MRQLKSPWAYSATQRHGAAVSCQMPQVPETIYQLTVVVGLTSDLGEKRTDNVGGARSRDACARPAFRASQRKAEGTRASRQQALPSERVSVSELS